MRQLPLPVTHFTWRAHTKCEGALTTKQCFANGYFNHSFGIGTTLLPRLWSATTRKHVAKHLAKKVRESIPAAHA